jgi:UPF0755 protein
LKSNKAIYLVVPVLIACACSLTINNALSPMAKSKPIYYRVSKSKSMSSALTELETKGIVRNAKVAYCYGLIVSPQRRSISAGVYQLSAGMNIKDVINNLSKPLDNMLRIPEGKWVRQVARLIENNQVASAPEFVRLSGISSKFRDMNLPFYGNSLEGMLYPDTYSLPPASGAEATIRKQLSNFKIKTKDLPITSQNSKRVLTIASMVELEAADPTERAMIAGVIENRLSANMPLQIDATINYGMQIWRPLYYSDYKNQKSDYNTYLHKGLPPGPICSPTISSIKAALNPIKHKFIYYITMRNNKTLFSTTYGQHLKNIKLRDSQPK